MGWILLALVGLFIVGGKKRPRPTLVEDVSRVLDQLEAADSDPTVDGLVQVIPPLPGHLAPPAAPAPPIAATEPPPHPPAMLGGALMLGPRSEADPYGEISRRFGESAEMVATPTEGLAAPALQLVVVPPSVTVDWDEMFPPATLWAADDPQPPNPRGFIDEVQARHLAGLVQANVSAYRGYYSPELVAEFQKQAGLVSEGTGVPDGRYGARTMEAIKAFLPGMTAPAPVYGPRRAPPYVGTL
jgi:hypothetical protein